MTAARLRPETGNMMHREFIEVGYRIFPIYRFDRKGRCECGHDDCPAPGKHPRASNWQHTPEWDDDQVDSMEEAGFLDTGYGVLCRGLLVVDIDARNGGISSFKKLLKKVPAVKGAGLAVNTGSGGGSQHLYFRAPDDVSFVSHLPDYPGIDFKSSGYVVGPGSAHVSGGIYSASGAPFDIEDAPDELVVMLKRPERHRSSYNGHAVDVSHNDISDMLSCINNDDLPYDTWIMVGMAIHHATNGTGYSMWADWSELSGKHDPKHMDQKWHSFGRCVNPVTLGSLVHHAEQGGWVMPVSFVPDDNFHGEEDAATGDLPFNLDGIDLTVPPGFVGDVARWIENQSFRPRKHLAVAGALTAMGNIAGLHYTDDLSGVTTNLFTFCVAGARTGKEAIQQAVIEVHRKAGYAGCSHGGIKSEQEVTRNLVRHQAALYVVDEFGIFLAKVRNAQKKGGAAYLDGVLGVLMSAYGKANNWLLLTGDAKEDVRNQLLRELAGLEKRQDESPSSFNEKRIAAIGTMLGNLDKGLERPFLSLMGFTTPITFDGLIDHEAATNGFVGRSLIFNEHETAPRHKKVFRAETMPQEMEQMLIAIANDGEYDACATGRVEHYGERFAVPTDRKAVAMLEAASEWMEVQAEAAKDTGLESLYLGAYELVSKVSLILAIPERLRTAEHVRWAFALIRRDIAEKINLVIGNDQRQHNKGDALRARLLAMVPDDGVMKEGVILSRCQNANFRKEDALAALSALVEAGFIQCAEKRHPATKKAFRTYFR